MKNIYKKLLLLLAAAASLAACDSREDYIQLKCDEPEVVLTTEFGDSIINGEKYVEVFLNWGDSCKISYDFIDEYDDNITDYELSVPPLQAWGEYYYYDEFTPTYVEFVWDKSARCFWVKEKTTKDVLTNRLGMYGTYRDYTYIMTLIAKNSVGKKGYANIKVKFLHNSCPVPTITVRDGDSKYDKLITVSPNDVNGDVIEMYEYCIDGTTLGKAGYKQELWDQVSPSQREKSNACEPGKGAYNGTYITATTLSSVRHEFQSAGEHTIAVRCCDEWGYWSNWEKTKITIEV